MKGRHPPRMQIALCVIFGAWFAHQNMARVFLAVVEPTLSDLRVILGAPDLSEEKYP